MYRLERGKECIVIAYSYNKRFHRILGGLLSAHLLIVDPERPFGDLRPWVGYDDELLVLAMDLASRLMPAFDNSSTEIPLPRVNILLCIPTHRILVDRVVYYTHTDTHTYTQIYTQTYIIYIIYCYENTTMRLYVIYIYIDNRYEIKNKNNINYNV